MLGSHQLTTVVMISASIVIILFPMVLIIWRYVSINPNTNVRSQGYERNLLSTMSTDVSEFEDQYPLENINLGSHSFCRDSHVEM